MPRYEEANMVNVDRVKHQCQIAFYEQKEEKTEVQFTPHELKC